MQPEEREAIRKKFGTRNRGHKENNEGNQKKAAEMSEKKQRSEWKIGKDHGREGDQLSQERRATRKKETVPRGRKKQESP